MAAAQAGDRDAFGELYARYHPAVFGFALARVTDRHLAEDVASETFLRALRGIASVCEQGRDVGAWLVTIARNLVRDHAKSARTRCEQMTGEPGEPGEPGRGVVAGPEQVVLAGEAIAALAAAVGQLPADQRECVRLRFDRDLSVRAVAAVMGRDPAAVKSLQHRACRHLARLLCDPAGTAARRGVLAGAAGRGTSEAVGRARAAVARLGEHRGAGQVVRGRVGDGELAADLAVWAGRVGGAPSQRAVMGRYHVGAGRAARLLGHLSASADPEQPTAAAAAGGRSRARLPRHAGSAAGHDALVIDGVTR